jgi:hypothetical protein
LYNQYGLDEVMLGFNPLLYTIPVVKGFNPFLYTILVVIVFGKKLEHQVKILFRAHIILFKLTNGQKSSHSIIAGMPKSQGYRNSCFVIKNVAP